MKDDHAKRKLLREVEVGQVRVRVWTCIDPVEKGRSQVSIVRIVVDDDGSPRETPFLNRDDLLLAARALDVAHDYICRLEVARGAPP